MPPKRILILGGTGEAVALAARLDADPAFEPITSLAGRTRDPASVAGMIRMGGFGGVDGLARYLQAEGIACVVDATHPFAEQISSNAVKACRAANTARLRLERPPWQAQTDDTWIDVANVEEAAERVADLGTRVFLSIGRQELRPFEGLNDIWFLLRMIDPPSRRPPLARHEVVLARGPFDEDSEMRLLSQHGIDILISKNSGGYATYGKIAAARRLGLPVIIIGRPPAPAGEGVETAAAALDWLRGRPT